MNKNIDNLLTQVYELEGLLLVMQRHSGEIPQVVVERFKQKAQLVASEASSLEVKNNVPEETVVQPKVQEPLTSAQPPAFKGPEHVETTSAPAMPPESATQPAVVKEEPTATEHAAGNIAQAFSINDRFLFQRELFDGDATRLDETLALMQKMRDMNQVQRFMTDDLQWDTSDEVVKEFIRLIGLSFKQ